MNIQTSMLNFLLPVISTAILFILIAVSMFALFWKSFKKAKALSGAMRNLRIPLEIAAKSDQVLSAYIPHKVSVEELLKNLALIKISESYIQSPGGSETIFQMYPILSWNTAFDFKDSFLKCYSDAGIKSLNIFSYNFVSQYAAMKITEGIVESYFVDSNMTIVFNGKPLGHFDFRKHKVFDECGAEIGVFSIPETIKLKSVSINKAVVNHGKIPELKAEISIRGNKAASILLQSSTVGEIELVKNRDKKTDFHVFSDLNLRGTNEAVLVLGFGVSFFALLENIRQDPPLVHNV